jgi:hypothetical protein
MMPMTALPQESGMSRQHHPWGRFEPGAWKRVRVVTETIDEKGAVIGTRVEETRTIFLSIDHEGVTLEMQTNFEVAGKPLDFDPKIVKQGFHGEVCGRELKIQPAAEGNVAIEGQNILCRMLQFECANANGRTLTRVFYSDSVAPYVLRREQKTTDSEGNSTLSEVLVEVEALNMPARVLGEIKNTAIVKTFQKYPKGSTTTWSVTSSDVPGGLVSHMSKETDANGRLVRRSTLELVSCGKECDDDTLRIFGRKRRGRIQSPPTYPLR